MPALLVVSSSVRIGIRLRTGLLPAIAAGLVGVVVVSFLTGIVAGGNLSVIHVEEVKEQKYSSKMGNRKVFTGAMRSGERERHGGNRKKIKKKYWWR